MTTNLEDLTVALREATQNGHVDWKMKATAPHRGTTYVAEFGAKIHGTIGIVEVEVTELVNVSPSRTSTTLQVLDEEGVVTNRTSHGVTLLFEDAAAAFELRRGHREEAAHATVFAALAISSA